MVSNLTKDKTNSLAYYFMLNDREVCKQAHMLKSSSSKLVNVHVANIYENFVILI